MSVAGHDTNIVVVALIHRGGRVFVARRAETKETWPGQLELVGGHVDPGEALEDALRREVREEIGVDVQIGQIVGAFTYESEDTFKVEICYLCELTDQTTEPQINPEDHSEGLWIGHDNLSVLEEDDDETRIIEKALELIGQSQKEGEQYGTSNY